jgi:hypothetical protein
MHFKRVSVLTAAIVIVLSACTVQFPSVMDRCDSTYESIGAIMATCPLECELSAIESDFSIIFDEAVTMPAYECLEGHDPTEGENPRLVFYQLIRTMAALEFDQPLPWTDLPLYEWLGNAINGFVITSSPESYCCDDYGRIVISIDDLDRPLPTRWDSPHPNTGLCDLAGRIIHEARHAEVGPHTCGEDDTSTDELGPWGVQYYFYVWLAEHTPPGMLSDLELQCAIAHAQMQRIHFCNP